MLTDLDTIRAEPLDPDALEQLLEPRRWALSVQIRRLPEHPTYEALRCAAEGLVGLVIYAGERLGLLEERVDEGQLARVEWLTPGELWGDAERGLIALGVATRDGSHRVWMYRPGARVELPARVLDLDVLEGTGAAWPGEVA